MLRLSRSLSRFETQDIKTQPQFNHYLSPSMGAESMILRETTGISQQPTVTIILLSIWLLERLSLLQTRVHRLDARRLFIFSFHDHRHLVCQENSDEEMKGLGSDGHVGWAKRERYVNEPTWRCHQNPFIGALGIINLLSLASHKSRLNRSLQQLWLAKERLIQSPSSAGLFLCG